LNQTREGYAGIQRYPYLFAGDWPSEWQYFAPVIKAGLNAGLSGVGHWTHCMGGFEHAADPELYIRWVQFGMFSPVAMVFGMDHPGYKEPWNYGPDALRNFKKYDSLRYQLLPYIYSNAYEMYKNGTPLMHALVFDYQDDDNVYETGDQYMFGNNLMVCPVVTKGAQTRTVYLPEGNWYDWWTGKKYSGKQYIHVTTPLDTMPVFAKSGAIIPMQPAMSYVGEKYVKQITLDIFPGSESAFDLYEDDGESLKYEQGEFSVTKILSVTKTNGLNINIVKPTGLYIPHKHNYLVKIHSGKGPKQVTENQMPVSNETGNGWWYDSNAGTLFINTLNTNTKNISIDINF
jgi:alpha-glucosidase